MKTFLVLSVNFLGLSEAAAGELTHVVIFYNNSRTSIVFM